MAITSAKEVWENQDKSKWEETFKKACESVMRAIKRASEDGERSCGYYPRVWDEEDHLVHLDTKMKEAIRHEFIKNGYTFRPTGIIDGVMQKSERICW